ncbi:MAG TPA: cystathionine gamma-synthase, partial [Solibacterales bacterium]|nr:cystathionine gamma-synthase [Bryobacterales bacterium]
CSSGMQALNTAILVALMDRRRVVLAANALYGATINLLMKILEPAGVEVHFADFCDIEGLRRVAAEHRPGVLLMETVSNPLLRVAPLDQVAAVARDAGAALIVDSTFSTPVVVRPLEWGAHMVVHSVTKYLSGHGDVLAGIVVSDEGHLEALRAYSRTTGPVLGPQESYLAMRGIKTFPLRMERQCQNACRVASWLTQRPEVERVYFTGDPAHPDAATIARLFTPGLTGAVVSFELKGAGREDVFDFMNRLKMIVPATSVGDVHSMMLYPTMSSHRELSPKHRERMGIRENLVRLSTGIEAVEDITADLEQALIIKLGVNP